MSEDFLKQILLDIAAISPKDKIEAECKRNAMEQTLVKIIEIRENPY